MRLDGRGRLPSSVPTSLHQMGGGFLGRSPTPAKYLSTAGVFGKLQALGVCQRDTLFDAQNTYIDTRDRDETVLRIIS